MSMQEPTDPRRRCSMVPAYALGALALLSSIEVLTSLSDIDEFIRQTGGGLCFVYSNVRIYATFHLIDSAFIAVLAMITARLARRGHCRFSIGFSLLSFMSFWLFTYLGAGGCGPH